jgi:hypothetical protein
MPDNALPREELAGGSAAGIVPRPLLGNGSGKRGAAMAEILKMLVEEFSRHLQEALSQEQPLPSPCFGGPSSVLLSTGSLPPPVGEVCHRPGYM